MQTTTQVSAEAAAKQAVEAAVAAATAAQDAAAAQTTATPETGYLAARATRDELKQQLDALVSQRHSFLREIEDHNDVAGPATAGMQQRIVQLDGRIAQLDIAIANADAAVAAAAAIPGAVVERPRPQRDGPPDEFFIIAPVMAMVVLLPVAISLARRMWRRGSAAVQQLPSDLSDRLSRLEAMGETTALEVERIGEGQRFVTRLLTDRANRELGEGVPAQVDR